MLCMPTDHGAIICIDHGTPVPSPKSHDNFLLACSCGQDASSVTCVIFHDEAGSVWSCSCSAVDL